MSHEETARSMLDDLRAFRLDVALAPAKHCAHHGHMVRVVQGQNPDWYQALCARHTCQRKKPRQRRLHDTSIKRQRVYKALEAIVRGWRFTYHRDEIIALVEAVEAGEYDWINAPDANNHNRVFK